MDELDLPESKRRQITARQDGQCNTHNPDVCTHTIDLYALAYPAHELKAMRRDPDSVDNMRGLCQPCAHRLEENTP